MTGVEWAEAFVSVSRGYRNIAARMLLIAMDDPAVTDDLRAILIDEVDECNLLAEQVGAIWVGILRAFEVPGW